VGMPVHKGVHSAFTSPECLSSCAIWNTHTKDNAMSHVITNSLTHSIQNHTLLDLTLNPKP
jgi:hypothetical protein